jgi:hypothetical protein
MNKNARGRKLGREFQLKARIVSRLLPQRLTATCAASPAMSLIPVAPLKSPAGSLFQKVAGLFDLVREAFLIGQRAKGARK